MHRRRDRLSNYIIQKGVLEDIFKSIAWVVLCGTIFKLSIASGKSGNLFEAVSLFFSFCLLFAFVMTYICIHIVMPMAKSLNPPFGFPEDNLRGLSGYAYIKERFKIILTKPVVFYMVVSMAYFILGNGLAGIIAKQL